MLPVTAHEGVAPTLADAGGLEGAGVVTGKAVGDEGGAAVTDAAVGPLPVAGGTLSAQPASTAAAVTSVNASVVRFMSSSRSPQRLW
jgi:hypothetical protein